MTITASDLQAMVTHWLGCPPDGYLWSSYGSDVAALLQQPLSGTSADEFIDKLREDVPLTATRQDVVELRAVRSGVDKLQIGIDVLGSFIILDGARDGVSQV